jgi:hypothetical protein
MKRCNNFFVLFCSFKILNFNIFNIQIQAFGILFKQRQKALILILSLATITIAVRFLAFSFGNKESLSNNLSPHEHHDHMIHKAGDPSGHENLFKAYLANREKELTNVDLTSPNLKTPPKNRSLTTTLANSLTTKRGGGRYDIILDNLERIVHLDLKGAPPKPEYLKKFIPFIKEHGATGILLEYEDMFPYSGRLAEARHGNAYSLEDIAMIKQLAKENGLTIMPLVQTYGHLEWLLKVKSFAHLRESAEFTQVISPCINETYTVLFGKIKILKSRKF